jgi:hypothetical protein
MKAILANTFIWKEEEMVGKLLHKQIINNENFIKQQTPFLMKKGVRCKNFFFNF